MTMTVKELINALSEYPDDMPVMTEGCDCHGSAESLEPWGKKVLISRTTPEEREARKRQLDEINARLDARDEELRAKGLIA